MTKNSLLGTMLTIAATGLATYFAMKNKDKLAGAAGTIATGVMNAVNQGVLPKLPLRKMNGSTDVQVGLRQEPIDQAVAA